MSWNLKFLSLRTNWEVDLVVHMQSVLQLERVALDRVDKVVEPPLFPIKDIWLFCIPSKVVFCTWETTCSGVLTLDMVQMRGMPPSVFSLWP